MLRASRRNKSAFDPSVGVARAQVSRELASSDVPERVRA